MIGGLLVILFSSLAASAQGNYDWREEKMPYSHQNIQVPRKVWQTIKSILKKDGVKKEVINKFTIYPTTVDVELRNHEQSILAKAVNHRLSFTEGGGELDFFDYVQRKGRFYLKFQPHLSNSNDFHILYVSDSPGKRVAEADWGNGCGNIYDLSQNYKPLLSGDGILLTTAKKHYMHLLAGTFIFFQLVDEQMYMGYIRLKDSRYPQFTCIEEL